jgi:hypothetical protein
VLVVALGLPVRALRADSQLAALYDDGTLRTNLA